MDDADLDFGFNRHEEEVDNLGEPEGPAVARITGRLARLDPIGDGMAEVTMWLVVEDDGYLDPDGEPRPGIHQAIKIRAKTGLLWRLSEACEITAVCRWHRGQLTLAFLGDVRDCEDPPPEARIPARKTAGGNPSDGHLPPVEEVDKAARSGDWGALNHSVFRVPIAWHITMAPKCRRRAFEGRAAEVQIILRGVAEAEGLTVIAIAAEEDHIHLLGIPAGAGGMPPTWAWATWIGRWKALTSRRLKILPGLDDFQWQSGYALTCVSGGRQGAEEALAVVEGYIRAQGDQSQEPPAPIGAR